MRRAASAKLEAGRIRVGPYASDGAHGLTGAFQVTGPNGSKLIILATDGVDPLAQDWEHVSVSVGNGSRCPNWPEMCFVKDLFWDEDEAVLQFHPPKSVYVNYHPTTLHMWRHRKNPIETPDPALVGPKSDEVAG